MYSPVLSLIVVPLPNFQLFPPPQTTIFGDKSCWYSHIPPNSSKFMHNSTEFHFLLIFSNYSPYPLTAVWGAKELDVFSIQMQCEQNNKGMKFFPLFSSLVTPKCMRIVWEVLQSRHCLGLARDVLLCVSLSYERELFLTHLSSRYKFCTIVTKITRQKSRKPVE